jgi:hypothetical protein
MAMEDDAGPIASELANDPAQHERLERFVVALGERVDRLQDLEMAQDTKQLEAEARILGYDAAQHGYAPLVHAAEAVQRACGLFRPGRERAAVRESVRALTDVASRVRLGHRGALGY